MGQPAVAQYDAASVSESIFRRAGDDLYEPTELARGPWDPDALHGGAPAALIAGALECLEPVEGLETARLDFEFVRPVPLAALRLSTRVAHSGRRVQRLEAELREAQGEERVVCRAGALRIATAPAELSAGVAQPLRSPDESTPAVFSLDGGDLPSFAATAMEMRWARGEPFSPGPAAVWFRLRHPVVEHEPPTPLMRLMAAADFGNGISAELPFDRWLFVNADLSVRRSREPRGDWIGLDARTIVHPGGTGLAVSELHDIDGPLGLAQQALIVQRR